MTDTKTDELRQTAQALRDAADRLRDADSTTETEFSAHFDTARKCDSRQERAVARIYTDGEEIEDVKVSKLQNGEHYRNPDADAVIGFSLPSFATVDQYTQHMSTELTRQAQAMENNAAGIEAKRAEKKKQEARWD